MRIVHVVEPFSSGVVTSIIQLCDGLSDYEHIVIHGQRTTQDNVLAVRNRFSSKVKFVVWKNAVREIRLFKDFIALIELYFHVKKLNADVLHLHSSKAGGLGRIVGKILGVRKIIYSPHSAPFLRKDIKTATNTFYILIEKLLAKISNEIVCCSASEAQEFKKLGINTTYINNGIVPTPVVVKTQTEPILIGCAAIATTQKRPKLFNQIAETFVDNELVKFIWIGDGELRSELKSPNIELTGWKNKEETKKLLTEIDIYLSCSLWEGLPYAVIEAMDLETCLVLSNCVGNIDLVEPNKNGYVFSDQKEATTYINKLIRHPEMIKNMGLHSRELVNKSFNAKAMCDSYKSIYSKS